MGGSRKIRKGKGVLASYRGTIYFTENSLKIIQNFTERGGGVVTLDLLDLYV